MENSQEIYADGIGEIVLAGGMVRMDLVVLAGSKRDEQEPKLETRQRLIMPPDGFLRSFSAMEDLVKQLIKAGLIKPRDQDGAPAVTSEVAAVSGAQPPKSPNFSDS